MATLNAQHWQVALLKSLCEAPTHLKGMTARYEGGLAHYLAEARAERQMAQVEERQKKLADLAESALTEVRVGLLLTLVSSSWS